MNATKQRKKKQSILALFEKKPSPNVGSHNKRQKIEGGKPSLMRYTGDFHDVPEEMNTQEVQEKAQDEVDRYQQDYDPEEDINHHSDLIDSEDASYGNQNAYEDLE